jgi:DNA-binding LacI/PurR family transcriptional regulator
MSKRATIEDVAQRAGVSRSAVSKVLRNAYGISDQMRACVEQAMAALDYRPQMAARGLRGRTYTLGVVMPEMRNPFFSDIMEGIWSGLQGTEYQPLIAVRHSAEHTEERLVETMLDRKIDGLLMIAPMVPRAYLWRLALTVPVVIIGRHEVGAHFDTVNNDDEKGAYLAVSHLIAQGHRRIAFLTFDPPEDSPVNPVVFRERGYVAAMQAHGLNLNIVKLRNSDGQQQECGPIREILSSDQRPTAIFAWHDSVALSVLAEAYTLGLQVPQDLAVAGYDNQRIGALPQLQLTSVDQNAHSMGEAATRLLIQRIEGRTESVDFVTVPTLVARRSTEAVFPGR